MQLHSITSLPVLGFSFFAIVSTSPLLSDDRHETRKIVPATDPTVQCTSSAPFKASCWDLLDMTSYVSNWTRLNREYCSEGNFEDNIAACFTFQILKTPYPCSQVGRTERDESSICGIEVSKLQACSPQEAYTLVAIYGIWKWFRSLANTIRDSPPDVVKGIQLVADQFDRPSMPFSLDVARIWHSLGSGLLDTPLPAASNATLYSAFVAYGNANNPGPVPFVPSTQPFDTASGRVPNPAVVKWDPASNPFDESVIRGYAPILDQGLKEVVTSPFSFLAATANGAFINDQDPPKTDPTRLFRGLYIYILSQYVTRPLSNDKSIIATVSRQTDPFSFHKYNHDAEHPISCDYYEQGGTLCSTWYHNNQTNATYSWLNAARHHSSKNYYEALSNIFASNILDGEDIFLYLDECRQASGSGQQYLLSPSTGRTISCLNSFQMGLEEFSPTCDAWFCEFVGGREHGEIELLHKSTPDWAEDHCFPAAYLGDRRNDEKMKPC